jgi:hypothetical protein
VVGHLIFGRISCMGIVKLCEVWDQVLVWLHELVDYTYASRAWMKWAFWVARNCHGMLRALFYHQAENQAALHVKLYLP